MHTLDEIMAVAQPRALAKRVAKTGQTTCYDVTGGGMACAGTGQDGAYQAGIDPAVAPTSGMYNTPWGETGVRFTDNGDGTVTDNLTALIWLKKANCLAAQAWDNALSAANALASPSCGLSDGSVAGAWRLPNVNELHSLGPMWPPGAPFTGVQSGSTSSTTYWSSTSFADLPRNAWYVRMEGGVVSNALKYNYRLPWPVRGGQ